MKIWDIFSQNNYAELEKQGGFKKKYEILVNDIENLSKEKYYPATSLESEVFNHAINSTLLKPNEYVISIRFIRPYQTSVDLDHFKLVHKQKNIFIEYTRESKGYTILPPIINLNAYFDNSLNQHLIFISLLENIENMFNKRFKYSDEHFAQIIQKTNRIMKK